MPARAGSACSPFSSARISDAVARGTEGSNPSPSSEESANFRSLSITRGALAGDEEPVVPGDHRPFAPERIEQADGKIGIEKYLLVSIFRANIKSL